MSTGQAHNLSCQLASSSPVTKTMDSVEKVPDANTQSGSAPETAPATVAPAGFTADYCYGLLQAADKQVSANTDIAKKNQRNISRLARGAVNLNMRMRAQERRGIKG